MRRKLLRMHGLPIKRPRSRFSELLSRFNLDESAIEAEAIRKSSSDVELLDRMLTSLESRRDKALGCVAQYRASLAHQLRESADRIIDGKDVLHLEHVSGERPPPPSQHRAHPPL